MIRKSTIKEIPVFLFSLYIVLSSYSIYMIVFPISSYIQMSLLGICAVIFLFYFSRNAVTLRVLLEPLIILALLLFTTLFNMTDFKTAFMCFIRFLMIYYAVAVMIMQGCDIMRALYRAIFCLMILFLVCYVVFDYIIPSAGLSVIYTKSTDIDGTTKLHAYANHFNIYFRWATSNRIMGLLLPRCSGFCWEPGQYQIYLNYVLMYLLYFDKTNDKMKKFRVALTIVSIITTTSTMGLFIMIILIVGAVLNFKSNIKFPMMVILSAIGIYLIFQLIAEKKMYSGESYGMRVSEFDLLGDILFNNSIFGSNVRTRSMANGILRFLWQYGYIALAMIAVILIYIFRKHVFINTKRQKVFFTVWLVLALFKEPIEYMNFTFVILSIVSLGNVLKNSSSYKSVAAVKKGGKLMEQPSL